MRTDVDMIVKTHTILTAVADVYGITREQLLSRSRKTNIADAKKLAQWMLYYSDYPTTLKSVAAVWGADHTTIIHNHTALSSLMATDENVVRKFLLACLLLQKPIGFTHLPAISLSPNLIILQYSGEVRFYTVQQLQELYCPFLEYKKSKSNLAESKRNKHKATYTSRAQDKSLDAAKANQMVHFIRVTNYSLNELYEMFCFSKHLLYLHCKDEAKQAIKDRKIARMIQQPKGFVFRHAKQNQIQLLYKQNTASFGRKSIKQMFGVSDRFLTLTLRKQTA